MDPSSQKRTQIRCRRHTDPPFETWVVVSAIVSILDQLFGVSQFESQSLAPLLQVRAQPPLLLIALWIYCNSVLDQSNDV